MHNGKIRIGIMGLGLIGRHLYHLALESDDSEIVAVADIGKPEILQYLLKSDGVEEPTSELRDNYLINEKFRTRMLQLARPGEVPWPAGGLMPTSAWSSTTARSSRFSPRRPSGLPARTSATGRSRSSSTWPAST